MIDRPIFLVGAERSGTTLLRLMLDHHPFIAFMSEFEYSVSYLPESGWPEMGWLLRKLEADRTFYPHQLNVDRSLSYSDLMDSFLRQKRDSGRKQIVGATVHTHFDRLLRIWPDARFVHLLRDGRDVARSCMAMNWAGNIWCGADRWITAELLWQELAKRLSPDRYITVRFEELITDPKPTLTRICQFSGTAYDPAMLDYANGSSYERPDPSLISQWRKNLKPEEVALVESRIGPMLAERGYELSGLPPIPVGAALERRLRRESKWAMALERKRRLGPWLFWGELLTRRLRMSFLHDVFQSRINAHTLSVVK